MKRIAGQPPVKPDGIHGTKTVLRRAFNQTDPILKFASREFQRKVADNGLLDALVAAFTALLGKQSLLTMTGKPEVDLRGLLMEMAYYLMHQTAQPPTRMS